MSSSDSDVQFVGDEEDEEPVPVRETRSVSSGRRNFCIEKNGVRQTPPSFTKARRPFSANSDGSSGLSDSQYTKRKEHDGRYGSYPQKRARQGHSIQVNTNLDIVEVDENTETAPKSQLHAATLGCQRKQRQSVRLKRKEKEKNETTEFNFEQLKEDRSKRDRSRPSSRSLNKQASKPFGSVGNVDSIEVLDDDDEREQTQPTSVAKGALPTEQLKDRGRAIQCKSPDITGNDDEVVPVEEEELTGQAKDSGAVDSPYTGSTHLIFEFPPGQRGKIRVTEEERGRLSQRKYLNDSLIDFYIKYHESDLERRAQDLRLKATFFSSFFFGRLRRTEPIDYDGVKGWTKNVDIFKKQYVFVPICESYHWSLIIVANLDKVQDCVDRKEEVLQSSPEAPRIIYLDSLDPKRGMEFGETMRQYLVEEWLAKRMRIETNIATRKATAASFKKVLPILRPNVPIQTNEYDCGLYLLNSFEMFLHNTDGLRDKLLSGSRDFKDAYSHVDITILRKSIINLMDILERQWVHEQLSREQESAICETEDAESLAPDEIAPTGTEAFISDLSRPLSGPDGHNDSTRHIETLRSKVEHVTMGSDQSAAHSTRRTGHVRRRLVTNNPDHISLVDAEDVDKIYPAQIDVKARNVKLLNPGRTFDPDSPEDSTRRDGADPHSRAFEENQDEGDHVFQQPCGDDTRRIDTG